MNLDSSSPIRDAFADIAGTAWLDAAHQGPLPGPAGDELAAALRRKRRPWLMEDDDFLEVPRRLRSALARLVGGTEDGIVLGNSASYGLFLLAEGLPWQPGDEVLVLEGDFPADLLPWQGLARHGVEVRALRPRRGPVPEPDDLREALTPATRLFCTTWVHSFSGRAVDVAALGSICRRRGVTFVLNGSQAVGALPLDVGALPVDAVTSTGSKWLCGPYGTGFLWLSRQILDRLVLQRTYWLSLLGSEGLDLDDGWDAGAAAAVELGARRYDVFGTANFFNFEPLARAVELLLEVGPERIARHDLALVDRLAAGLDRDAYRLVHPAPPGRPSPLLVVSHRDPDRNPEIHAGLRRRRVHCSLRQGCLRLAPHLYTTAEDVDRALAGLAELGR